MKMHLQLMPLQRLQTRQHLVHHLLLQRLLLHDLLRLLQRLRTLQLRLLQSQLQRRPRLVRHNQQQLRQMQLLKLHPQQIHRHPLQRKQRSWRMLKPQRRKQLQLLLPRNHRAKPQKKQLQRRPLKKLQM
jgi:hypothetical protein